MISRQKCRLLRIFLRSRRPHMVTTHIYQCLQKDCPIRKNFSGIASWLHSEIDLMQSSTWTRCWTLWKLSMKSMTLQMWPSLRISLRSKSCSCSKPGLREKKLLNTSRIFKRHIGIRRRSISNSKQKAPASSIISSKPWYRTEKTVISRYLILHNSFKTSSSSVKSLKTLWSSTLSSRRVRVFKTIRFIINITRLGN